MNELLIGGIVLAWAFIFCSVTIVIENREEIGEWLFDVQTAYYKKKQHRRNKDR